MEKNQNTSAIRFAAVILYLTVLAACSNTTAFEQERLNGPLPDPSSYIRYEVGTIPIIISVPHGGAERPVGFQTRRCPGSVHVTDSYTIELAEAIQKEFIAHNLRAHIVISELSRSILDPNRDRDEATCSEPRAGIAWDTYHFKPLLKYFEVNDRQVPDWRKPVFPVYHPLMTPTPCLATPTSRVDTSQTDMDRRAADKLTPYSLSVT